MDNYNRRITYIPFSHPYDIIKDPDYSLPTPPLPIINKIKQGFIMLELIDIFNKVLNEVLNKIFIPESAREIKKYLSCKNCGEFNLKLKTGLCNICFKRRCPECGSKKMISHKLCERCIKQVDDSYQELYIPQLFSHRDSRLALPMIAINYLNQAITFKLDS